MTWPKNADHPQIAANVKALRLSLEWTQSQLAEALGISENTIGRWENGHVLPTLDHLIRLCDIANESLGRSQRKAMQWNLDRIVGYHYP